MYICTYSTNHSTTLIIIIIIIIHTIQYIYYNYTQYQIWYLFTLYCVMWRGYVIHQLLYILHYAILYVYIYPIPLWYMTMYITSHTILIYYNNYYYDNYNSYLFLFLLLCCCMCVRVYVCCAVLSLSLVCVCMLSCVSSHMFIHVYLCVFTPAHPPRPCCGEEANVLI